MSAQPTIVFVDLPRAYTVRAAMEMGMRAVALIGARGSSIGEICKDRESINEIIILKTLSAENILAAVKKLVSHGHEICGVVTHVESLIEPTNQAAEYLSPGLAMMPTWEFFRSKSLMKQRLAENSIPIARFRIAFTYEDAELACRQLGFPSVIKPNKGWASHGVVRVDSPQDLKAYFRTVKLIAVSCGDPSIVVEEYVPGHEIGVEAIAQDNRSNVVLISDKPEPLEGPFFEETMYVTPSVLAPTVQETIVDYTKRSLTTLGLRRGPSHLEFRVDGERCVLIEVAARPGSPPEYVSAALGSSYERLFLKSLLLGSRHIIVPKPIKSAGYMLVSAERSGVLARVKGIEQVKDLSGITSVGIWKK